MSAEWKAVVWLVALVLAVLASFGEVRRNVHLGWLAVAAFVLPFLWDAADAGWFDD